MAIDSTSSVSGNTLALFKQLGFHDKNNNGVIEKTPEDSPEQDEGYKYPADINNDGKIVLSEAKYFLQNLEQVDQKVKDEYPLTEDDKQELLALFREALVKYKKEFGPDSTFISYQTRQAVGGMLNLGYLKEALETAPTIETSVERSEAYKNIAVRMAKTGKFKESLETAKNISDVEIKADALISIGSEMTVAGQDKHEIIKTLQEALEIARSIPVSPNGYNVDKTILIRQAAVALGKAGLSKKETLKIFHEALKLTHTVIQDPEIRAGGTIVIAEAMSEVKQDKDDIAQFLFAAMEDCFNIANPSHQSEAIGLIIKSTCDLIGEKSKVRDAIKKYISNIRDIKDQNIQDLLIENLAIVLAKAQMFEESSTAASNIRSYFNRDEAINMLILEMRKAGIENDVIEKTLKHAHLEVPK